MAQATKNRKDTAASRQKTSGSSKSAQKRTESRRNSSASNKAHFQWKGINKSGKKLTGDLPAENVEAVRAELRRQGIRPLSVRKTSSLFTARKPAVKTKDIAIFSRMLATMVASGVPLLQSLEIIGNGADNASVKKIVLAVAEDVRSGTSLELSLAKFPRYFDALFTNLVGAGEKAGTLDTVLGEIAYYQEKTEAIKSKIKKAMVYPASILAVAFLVTAILMVFVIPQFEELFSGFGADLPALTKAIVNMSHFFQKFWWLIFGCIFLAIYTLVQAIKRSKKVHESFDRFLLKLPVIGTILNKGAIARFARTTATMFSAGVPLVEALGSVAGATGNVVYTEATLEIRDEVATGTPLNQSMAHADLFPSMMVQMTAIGEQSGALDTMLAKVADFYEDEVDDAVDNLSALMEPAIMVILGGLIGTMVIAMYLPIFKMGSVI